MALEDLDFKIKGDVKDSMSSIKQLAVQLLDVFKISERIDLVFDGFGESLALPVRQIDMLTMRVEPLAETLARADKQAHALEEAFTRRLMEKR